MPDTFITTTEISKLRPFYYQNKPMYEWFKVLNRRISSRLGDTYSQIFAEPKVNPYNKTVDWYTSLKGAVVALGDLPESERNNLLARAEDIRNSIKDYADKLITGTSSDDQVKGEFLLYALRISNSFPCLYSVDGNPVIIGWGSKDEDGSLTKTEFADRESSEPKTVAGNLENAQTKTPQTVSGDGIKQKPVSIVPPVKQNSWCGNRRACFYNRCRACGLGWLPAWLSWLLGLILLLLILWLLFKFLFPWLFSSFFDKAYHPTDLNIPKTQIVENQVVDPYLNKTPEKDFTNKFEDVELHRRPMVSKETSSEVNTEIPPHENKFEDNFIKNTTIAIDSNIYDDSKNPIILELSFKDDLSDGKVNIKLAHDKCSGSVAVSKPSDVILFKADKVICTSGDVFDPFDLACDANHTGLSRCVIRKEDGQTWAVKATVKVKKGES